MAIRRLIACLALCTCCCVRQRADDPYARAVGILRDGNTPDALRVAREAEAKCPKQSKCRWMARLLQAEILVRDNSGQNESAAAILAETVPAGDEYAEVRIRQLTLQAALQLKTGHYPEAGALLSQVMELAKSRSDPELLLDAQNWEGQLLAQSSQSRRAEEVYRRARTQAAAIKDQYHQALASNGLGMIRLRESRWDEAIPMFQEVLDAAGRGGGQRLARGASLNLGICYARLGVFDRAIASLKQTVDVLGTTGPTLYRMNALGEMGIAYNLQGDVRTAIPLYEKAASLANSDAEKALWYGSLASALAGVQDWDRAEQTNEESRRYAKTDKAKAYAAERAGIIAAGRGDYEKARTFYREAIELAGAKAPDVVWESHAYLAKADHQMGDFARARKEYEVTRKFIDENVTSIARDDYKMTFFARLIVFYRQYVEALVARKEYSAALDIADSSRARILFQRLGLKQAPPSERYQKLAAARDSVLLFYWIAPERSYLWVVTKDKVHPPFELPAAAQLQQWVDQYLAFTNRSLADPMVTTNEAGRHLYDALIAPASRLIPRGSKVILVPDGALHWLNFETLPVYGATPDAKPRYWVEDVRLSIAPSLGVLAAEEEPKAQAPGSMLIIGDPVSPSPDFPALAYASKEIECIRQRIPGAEKTVGAEASPRAYARADKFALLHFSTHAVANEQSPLDSAIILSRDGDNFKLYAKDILALPLHADLVTISACRSAGARSYSGEGLVGFAWAFCRRARARSSPGCGMLLTAQRRRLWTSCMQSWRAARMRRMRCGKPNWA